MTALADHVTSSARWTLLGALALTLAATAVGLDAASHATLDAALAAAANNARGAVGEDWHLHLPAQEITVETWSPGSRWVDDAAARDALEGETPVWRDVGGWRVLLAVAEPPHPDEIEPDAAEDHPHQLLIAASPHRGFLGTASGVLAIGGASALAVAALASWWLGRRVHAAMAPLRDLADALDATSAAWTGPGIPARAAWPASGFGEVDRVVDATSALLERLERAATAQARFTADAAHELRTPVTVLVGEVELALRRPRSEDALRDTLRRLLPEVHRLSDRLNGLMALAHVDAGGEADGWRTALVTDVVADALDAEASALRAAGNAVETAFGTLPSQRVHPAWLRMAVGNLLRNVAVHAPGTQVHLRVDAAAGGVDVVVEDGGPGVAPGRRGEVLRRAVRDSGDGLGIGLSLVAEVAARHGGRLTLDAAASGGLRATLWLPTSGFSSNSHEPPS